MRFWDSSALIPLLVSESTSERIKDLLRREPGMAVWWATPVECASALVRRHQEGKLPSSGLSRARAMLARLSAHAFEIQPVEEVRACAVGLLAAHRLRAADSLQLAAALTWRAKLPQGAAFLCLDSRLRAAAALEGFTVMPYSDEINEPEIEAEDWYR